MRKLFTIILAIFIANVAMIPILTVSAINNATFVVGNASGKVGDNVDVAVNIDNNPGITAMHIMIDYSAEDLELVSLKDEGLFNNAISNSKLTNNSLKISWYSKDSVNENNSGILATLTFKILKDFDESEINISYDADNVFDINFDNVNFGTQNGVVSVESEVQITVPNSSEPMVSTAKTETSTTKSTESSFGTTDLSPEFLSGDAVVNINDATTVQKYVALLIDLSDEAKLCADFDQNGKINIKDVTGIQKRIAGL